VEEQEKTSSVVQLRHYFERRTQDKHYRIIVADDSATNRQVIGKILERGGHAVTLVEDGEDVLDALEASQFDLVVLDRNMPGMGGIETLRALRLMNLGNGRLPVVILSADVTSETREDCMAAGADAFLPKPVEAIRLLDSVAELCGDATKPRAQNTGRRGTDLGVLPVSTLNMETLRLLEGLGTQNGFLERLIGVFISDNAQLLQTMERSVGNRDFLEFRRLLHAMKGSAASIGAERLAQVCSATNGQSDAEMRLQTRLLVEAVRREFDIACAELGRYLESRQRTAG
jgi:two-component system sensor histidine kinase RpfC